MHSERPKLHRVLAVLSGIGLTYGVLAVLSALGLTERENTQKKNKKQKKQATVLDDSLRGNHVKRVIYILSYIQKKHARGQKFCLKYKIQGASYLV